MIIKVIENHVKLNVMLAVCLSFCLCVLAGLSLVKSDCITTSAHHFNIIMYYKVASKLSTGLYLLMQCCMVYM